MHVIWHGIELVFGGWLAVLGGRRLAAIARVNGGGPSAEAPIVPNRETIRYWAYFLVGLVIATQPFSRVR